MNYQNEIKCLMFVNGDCDHPNDQASRLLEEIILCEVRKLLEVEESKLTLSDVMFLFRSHVKLLIRVCRQATIWDQKEKTCERGDEIEEGLKVIDFKNRLSNTLDTTADPLKNERLKRESERIRNGQEKKILFQKG